MAEIIGIVLVGCVFLIVFMSMFSDDIIKIVATLKSREANSQNLADNIESMRTSLTYNRHKLDKIEDDIRMLSNLINSLIQMNIKDKK